MNDTEFTPKDIESIQAAYEDLMAAAVKRCANEKEIAVVQKAFDFANSAHRGIRRRSGEPYILHPIAVAKIVVSDIGLGYKSISAALLHDVVEDTDYTVEDIRNLFGEKIASLVDGLTKIKTVLDKEDRAMQKSMQAENFKRILLTLNDDVRVVLIKLADRLHNCRTIEYMPEYKKDKILSETMFIFIPLAHRLGLYGVKSEMEDIWLRHKEPETFKQISSMIQAKCDGNDREIDNFIQPIENVLTKAGFTFEIKKRIKSPYSVWHKMQTKNVGFDQVYDLYAVRIIFDPLKVIDPSTGTYYSERNQCFHIFSLITGIYNYKPDRVRDWVQHPKSNGYEALHCTLMSNSGIWIEVQIRSRRMDDIAEKGIAAHWTYKRNGLVEENESEMDRWISKVKEILVNPDVNALELLDIIHNDLTTSDIFVFTPKGDQKTIQKGASALDFAYMIHSHIGNKAIAAKVNMKLVPLSHVLQTGDQVEIITAEDAVPQREWLQFLTTRKARNVVTDFFKNERQNNVSQGRNIIEERLKDLGIEANEDMMRRLLREYAQNDMEEFFFRINIGTLNIDNLEEVVRHCTEKQRTWKLSNILGMNKKKVIDGDYQYIVATCCNPIPGDNVVGFLGEDGTVTVHKRTCRIAESLASKHGDKIVIPDWNDSGESFLVGLAINGIDRMGILNEITRYISLVMGVNIRKIAIESHKELFHGNIELYITNRHSLEKLINKLKKIDGVQNVVRVDLKK